LPTKIEEKCVRVAVDGVPQESAYQFLPRIKILLKLDVSKYPSKDPPDIEIHGFFASFADIIVEQLKKRFDPGQTVLFDWFYFLKDEMFTD
jgi:hypothetical protein